MHSVLNQMKNQFSDFYFLSYGWLYLQFTDVITGFSSRYVTNPKKKSFQSGQIHRKDAQWAETNEKSIFHFLWFLFFWVMVDFVLKINQKIDQFWVEK